jgi:hypothetical protein
MHLRICNTFNFFALSLKHHSFNDFQFASKLQGYAKLKIVPQIHFWQLVLGISWIIPINITVLYKTGQELQPKPILCELGYGFQVQIQIQISAYPFPKEVHHFGFSDSHTLM